MPSELNFRANIWGLKSLGAEWVVSVSAVGSMREEIHPLDLVIPDQFFDHTRRRVSTFFGDGIVAHVGMADAGMPAGRRRPGQGRAADGGDGPPRGDVHLHRGATVLLQGESRIYRSWGVDVIGMTNMPEAKLAREAELCYATLALVTDYDVWHDTHASVSVEAVVQNLQRNVATAKDVIRAGGPDAARHPRTCDCAEPPPATP